MKDDAALAASNEMNPPKTEEELTRLDKEYEAQWRAETARIKGQAAAEAEDSEEIETARVAKEARPKWRSTRKPDPPLATGLVQALDSVGGIPKNTAAGPAGSGPAHCSSDWDEIKQPVTKTTSTTDSSVSQAQKLGTPNFSTINKLGDLEIVAPRPAYSINKEIANAYIDSLRRELTLNECNLLGLLNSLMQRYGYAFASYERLAHCLRMKPAGVRSMINRLKNAGLLTDESTVYGKHRWVVRADLQNRRKRIDGVPF